MIDILTAFLVFLMILGITEALKIKPQWLVIVYYSIWERPFPKKKKIDKIGMFIAIITYVLLLTYIIYKQ